MTDNFERKDSGNDWDEWRNFVLRKLDELATSQEKIHRLLREELYGTPSHLGLRQKVEILWGTQENFQRWKVLIITSLVTGAISFFFYLLRDIVRP